jgi:hypothetical protein
MRSFLLVMFTLLMLCGCSSNHPVRHLAADASLIKPGITTMKEVVFLLGQPDGRRTVSPGVEEYVYHADQKGAFSGLPVVGSWVGNKGYEMIVITVNGELVTDCQFRTFNEDDQDWVNDFTWQSAK